MAFFGYIGIISQVYWYRCKQTSHFLHLLHLFLPFFGDWKHDESDSTDFPIILAFPNFVTLLWSFLRERAYLFVRLIVFYSLIPVSSYMMLLCWPVWSAIEIRFFCSTNRFFLFEFSVNDMLFTSFLFMFFYFSQVPCSFLLPAFILI
jgi:hypothetical protein